MLRAAVVLVVLAACAAPAPSVTPPEPASPPATGSRDIVRAAPSVAEAAWEVLEDAPFARLEMAVTAYAGRIWLAGGLSPLGEALAEVEVFDPATGEWSEGPSLPTGVHHAALVSDGERLILIGGYIGADFSRPTDIVLVLADGASEWVAGPSLPDPRAAGGAAFDGSRVVYAGGFSPNDIHSDVFVLEGDAWERIGTMSSSRDHLAATSDGNGTVWLMGGRVGGLDSNLGDRGDRRRRRDRDGRRAADAAWRRGRVLLRRPWCVPGRWRGAGGGVHRRRVRRRGRTVTTLPPLNQPHHGHGAAVVDGIAYVMLGGPEPTLSADSTVEAFTLTP